MRIVLLIISVLSILVASNDYARNEPDESKTARYAAYTLPKS